MDTKRLGNSDLDITAIGIGAWAIGGGGWKFGWGEQDDQASIDAIHAGLDHGMNWIDTAAVYGLGHSEEIVAKALAGRSNLPYVFTKCERTWDHDGTIGGTLKAASVRKEVEASLQRLKIEVIDLMQIHWPDPDEDIEEGWGALNDLKREGKLRWIGVSNFSASQMERASKIAPITSLQPPYSALSRDVEESVLPYALENNVGVIVYSPMKSGLLTGKMTKERVAALPDNDWRKNSDAFKEPALTKNLQIAEKFKEVGARSDKTAGEVAIAWTLRNPAVTAAIVGIRDPGQVDGIIGALKYRLTDDEYSELNKSLETTPVFTS